MGGADRVDLAARGVALGYAVVAGAWIVLSDSFFALIGDPAANVWGNMAKGLAFVGVTSYVLYRAVRALYRREAVLNEEVGRRSELQAALFNLSPEAMWVYDPETLRILEVNDTMVARYGRSRDELLALRTNDLGPAQNSEHVVHRVASGDRSSAPHLWLHFGPHGEHRWVEVVTHMVDWDGRVAMLALSRDITAQKRAEDALRSSEHRLAGVLASMQEMAFTIDLTTGHISYLNDVAAEVLGREPSDLMTLDDFRAVVVDDDQECYREAMRRVVKEGWTEAEFRVLQPNGGIRTIHARARGVVGPSGRVEQVDGVLIDMTHRQELVELIEHQRSFDQLTGLPNRDSFLTMANVVLAGGADDSRPAVVALFDLDRFAAVNESAGHYAGDAVLVAAAERVTSVLEPGMVAARVGGDEFAVFSPPGLTTAAELGERLQDAIDDVFVVGDYEFFISMSVGLAESVNGTDAESLLRDAHVAMTAAKQRTAGVEHFHPAYRSSITELVRLEGELRRALAAKEFVAVYQPLVSLTTDRIIGVEVLARWNHPKRGLVAAADFILAAERSSLIIDIGREMLDQACAQAARWRERYPNDAPRVWINLSRRELDAPDVVAQIHKTIVEHGLSPSAMGVEVTESAFVADGAPGVAALRAMAASGISIALDDFGTGWSSLQTLKAFPLSVVKIDRSFITNVGLSVGDTQITKAVIGMAKGMGLRVLAEGVETAEQLTHLRKAGCDEVQGYLLGRPGDAATIDEILETGGKPTVFLR